MVDVNLAVTLKLEGPVLTQASAVGQFGVDAPIARTSKGLPYLPGTLLKGRLLEAWEELQEAAGFAFEPDFSGWLGEKSGNPENGGGVEPRRGRLVFGDLVHDRNVEGGRRYRIEIDPKRGAAREGAYQIIESPFASGEEVTFGGSIQYLARDEEEAKRIQQYVEVGLRWVGSLGAQRTIGCGRLKEVNVERLRDALGIAEPAVGEELLGVCLEMQSPFCVARRRPNDTLFESEEVIPGGVIKGALARTWRAMLGLDEGEVTTGMDAGRPKLCEHFHRIRFTHFFPSGNGVRPVVAPLSLVKTAAADPERRFLDVIEHRTAAVICGEAPAFAVDWKNEDGGAIRKRFGWPEVARELRVRTAINKAKRRAMEEQLFAYETVVPGALEWLGYVDLGGVAPASDRMQVEEDLRSVLASPIRGLGKTKAFAKAAFVPEQQLRTNPVRLDPVAGCWAITLQTPAILCDPDSLQHEPGNVTSGQDRLWAAYSEAWEKLSEGWLTLENFFAGQSLAGGYYLHKRFRGGGAYAPWLLTDSGSVFLLRWVDEGKAKSLIGDWVKRGLPLPRWAEKRYGAGAAVGELWKCCPYIRENGYGEIAVNLSEHEELRPRKEEIDAIS